MSRTRRAPHVHKFGGASLADAAAVRHAAAIVRGHRTEPTVVVVSAMAGITDALLAVAEQAGVGSTETVGPLIARLRSRHAETARAVLPAGRGRSDVLTYIADAFDELEALAEGLRLLRERTPRATDALLSRGERLSARIFTAALGAVGVKAKYVDAVEIIHTDGRFGQAGPDYARTDRSVQRVLSPLLARQIVAVVPGFLGSAPSGDVATLGRGGSDLTAALLARALGARRISLWKDVPGLLTADPRVVPDARVVPQIHTREATELAYHGAKVLHPRALIPLAGRRIPLFVRPFADPGAAGTEVSERAARAQVPVRAISAAGGQALVTVTGSGMLGVPGATARTFAALHKHRLSASLITQASSEHSISFAVPEAFAAEARDSLLREFRGEIARGDIDGVEMADGLASIAVVGLGMQGTPGVAAGVFSALAAGGINVVAMAQDSSQLNISVVVAGRDAPEAQRRIHAAFQLSRIAGGAVVRPERMEVILLGFGQIGRTLTSLITKVRRPALSLHVAGIIDRSGFVFDPRGLSSRRLATLVTEKRRGRSLADAPKGRAATAEEAIAHMANYALTRPVLVDLTADETGPMLELALTHGMDIVLANKLPLAGRRGGAEALWQTARARGRRVLHEATVGAGLPVIDTYHKLIQSGDQVERIEGLLSGTLGYVLTEVSNGVPFSQAVRGAMAKGYTEPDPRADLAGLDVGRKALILARLLGYPGELDRTAVESLVPRWARSLSLPQFLARLRELDAPWQRRVHAATTRGEVLRYVASVTPTKIAVGLRAVPTTSPLANLKGTDNQLIFTTARYKTNPLVITGPGAGAEVTAAGVLNDILTLTGA